MDFDALFSGFNSKKVLVVGDAMIDAYMWGEINRMSPEAPVPVVDISDKTSLTAFTTSDLFIDFLIHLLVHSTALKKLSDYRQLFVYFLPVLLLFVSLLV